MRVARNTELIIKNERIVQGAGVNNKNEDTDENQHDEFDDLR